MKETETKEGKVRRKKNNRKKIRVVGQEGAMVRNQLDTMFN